MPDITTTLRVPRYAGAPGSPLAGQVYFDTGTNLLYFYNGTVWIICGGAQISGTPTNGQLALWTNATTIQGLTTLPAANTPAYTGDVTSSAGGTANTIAAKVVTYAKIQDITATSRFLGRITAGAGSTEELTAANAKTILALTAGDVGLTNVTNDAQTKAAIVPNTAPAAGQILVGNAGATAYAPVAMGTDATLSSAGALTIANNAVTLGKMATMATDSILGRATAATGNVEVLASLPFANTGDVTRPADSTVNTIAANAVVTAKILDANVTYAKIQNVSASPRLLGRGNASAGVTEEIQLGSGLSMTAGSPPTLAVSAGGGNVSSSGTPAALQYARWVTASTIEGVSVATVETDLGISNVTNDAQIKASDFPASSVDSEISLFSGTTGKAQKRATGSGIATVASGVLGTTPDNHTNWDTAYNRPAHRVIWFTAGTTYNVPAGVRALNIEAVGGGGGGGGVKVSSASCALGGCGAGGAYASVYVTSPAASYVITIGAGGSGGLATGTAGGNGGNTTVGAVCQANGGALGNGDTAGGSSGFVIGGAGGPGGSVGDMKIGGSDAQYSVRLSATTWVGGLGGASMWAGTCRMPTGTAAGGAGNNYGGGGAGGISLTTTGQTGGAGGPGAVKITEFY